MIRHPISNLVDVILLSGAREPGEHLQRVRDPHEFRTAARADLERYGSVTVETTEVSRLVQREDGIFEATAGGKTWTGKKVILSTGVEDVLPNIEGYSECWVSGM